MAPPAPESLLLRLVIGCALCLSLAMPVEASAQGFTFGPASLGRVKRSGDPPEVLFTRAELMIKRGAFDRAILVLNELRNFHRDDPLSVDAQLLLADVRFKKGDLEEARYAYEEFATYHPRHPAMDHVSYHIGLCIWKRAPRLAGRDQARVRSAVNAWTGFSDRFPDSIYRPEVESRLEKGRNRLAASEIHVARFYAKRDGWAAVRGRATYLLRRWPRSRYSEEALAWLATSSHRIGRVDDAQQAQQRLLESFPDTAWANRVAAVLSEPPGSPPEEERFVRPYRMSGFNPSQMPPQ